MVRSFFLGLILCMSLFVVAGNKADINSDQAVNATDSVVLTNILAGNIAIDNYDLYSVVVVAAQGGDFTDPADAADWVATQAPGVYNRFIISLAPGTYYLNRSIELPAYTTLAGQGREQCHINYFADDTTAPYGAAVVCDDVLSTSIENLSIYKGDGSGTGHNVAVYVQDCTTVIRNCDINVASKGDWTLTLWVFGSAVPTRVKVYNSRIAAQEITSGTGQCTAVYLVGNSYGEFHETDFSSVNQADTYKAYVIYHYPSTSASTLKVFHSVVTVAARNDTPRYYYYRYLGNAYAYFYFTQILSGTTNVADGDNSLKRLYCVDSSNPFP